MIERILKDDGVVNESFYSKKLNLRQKINRVLVGGAIFLACPGDDIVAIAPAALSGHVSIHMAIEPDTVLSMFCADKQTKDREDIEKEEAIKNS